MSHIKFVYLVITIHNTMKPIKCTYKVIFFLIKHVKNEHIFWYKLRVICNICITLTQ